ncbi:OmpA family protein [Vibrio sp. MA40-2]|uniref:OmpA family protein n=1 Tax=Vibrio sp. MA40-2 TaxID=3391828 RepID=UPI0039A4B36F
MKLIKFVLTTFLLMLVIPVSFAMDIRNADPQQLYTWATSSNNNNLRYYLRSVLAERYPHSPEGQFAQAWLETQIGNKEKSTKLLRQTISQSDDLHTGYFNLSVVLDDGDEKVGLLNKAYQAAVRNNYIDADFYLLEYYEVQARIDNTTVLDAFGPQLKSGNQIERSLYYYLKSAELRDNGEFFQAMTTVYEAVFSYPSTDNINRLYDYTVRYQKHIGASRQELYTELESRVVELMRLDTQPAIIEHVFSSLASTLDAEFELETNSLEAQLYEQAYLQRHSPAMALEWGIALGAHGVGQYEKGRRVLENLMVELPDYADGWDALAYYYYERSFDKNKFVEASKNSINTSKGTTELFRFLPTLANRYSAMAMQDEALKILENNYSKLIHHDNSDYTGYYYALVETALTAMQFEKADYYLNEAISKVEYNQYWEKYRTFIDMALSGKKQTEAFYQNNPFLHNWEDQFGKSIQLSLNFAVNSAKIPTSAYKDLDKAALALKREGGENYLFEVEGHTDSSGSDEVNIPLSKKRAESVVEYFQRKHGISSNRLIAKGFGATLPVASNWTDSGKKRNRRVEIKPMGNIQQPEFAVVGDLRSEGAAFSKDGRFMASGYNPIRLWDLERGITIRELYFGGAKREFSPDGRYLAVISDGTYYGGIKISALYIVDTKTGILHAPVSQFGIGAKFSELSWSPDNSKIAFTNNHGHVGLFDVTKNKLIKANRISNISIGGPIAWVAATNQIAVAQANSNKYLKLFNADTLELENTFDGVDWAHSMTYVPEHQKLVVANNNRTFSVYDVRSPETYETFSHSLPTPSHMVPIASSDYVLINDKFSSKAVSFFNFVDGTGGTINEYESDPYIGMSPDGRYALVSSNEKLVRYDLHSDDILTPVAEFEPATPIAQHLTLNKEHNFLISEDTDSTAIWHLLEGRKVHTIDKVNHLRWFQSDNDSSNYFSLTKEGDYVSFNLNDFKLIQHPLNLGFEPTNITYEGNKLVIAGVEQDSKGKGGKGYIALYDLTSLKKMSQTTVALNTSALSFSVWYGGFSDLDLSDDGSRLLALTWWNDGGRGNTDSKAVYVWDTDSLDENPKMPRTSSTPLVSADFMEGDTKTASIHGLTSSMDIEISTSKISNYQNSFSEIPTYDNKPRLSRDKKTLIYGEKTLALANLAKSVISDEKLNLAIVYTQANSMEFYQLDTLEKKLTIQNRRDGEWVAYTPNGYYNASLNGLEGVYWSFGDYLLPFENLQEKYISPQRVKQALLDIVDKRKTDDKPIIDNDVIVDMPYDVVLVGKDNVTTDQENYTVQLKVTKTDKSKPDPDFYFTINDRKTRGFESDPFIDEDESITVTRKVPLGIGENIVTAHLLYKGVVTYTKEIVISREESKNEGSRGTLWFFGVGVSEYENPLQNLDFAHRDALELEKALKKQQGKLFAKVHTKVLTDAHATARDIKIEMNEFLANAGRDDQVIIFIAGHGIQDGNQNLYFMAHDSELSKPYTGMAIGEFKAFLDRRPVNQKALFLLDICHSGSSIDKGRITAEDAVKALSQGTATTVFSSSKGAQQSFEDEAYGGGHGAFTYSLLQALQKGDEEMGDGDGYTSLMEMIFYTIREVPRLTDRAQTPSIPVLINNDDYPLAEVL